MSDILGLLQGWNGVLVAALLASMVAFASGVLAVCTTDARWSRLSTRMEWTAFGLAVAAFAWLMSRFIVVDLSYEYVFLYTARHIPLAYRISGTWTGREGSLLLWTLYLLGAGAVGAAVRRRRSIRADAVAVGIPDKAQAHTRIWLLGANVAFLAAVVAQDTFALTEAFYLQGRPDGNGINPTLMSPFILIHPPLMFLAYALTAWPWAAAMAHFTTGSSWSRPVAWASRLNWALYTVAMGLGGLWAYYTLGFGGYWAWDPVEVANFLPWLALTAFLHAQLRNQRDGGFATAGPLLALLPFIFTFFSTLSTRSGLWVSVHAFTDPTNSFDADAAARFLGILEVDASLRPLLGMMLGAMLVGLAFWCRRSALLHGTMERPSRVIAGIIGACGVWAALDPGGFLSALFEVGDQVVGSAALGGLGITAVMAAAAAAPSLVADDETNKPRIDTKSLLYVASLLLSLGLLIATLFHFASVNGWDRGFWEARVPWMATPVAAAMMILHWYPHRGRRFAVAAAGASVAIGIVAFLIGGLGAYAVAVSVALLVSALDKMNAIGWTSGWPESVLFVAALGNVAFWINPPSSVLGVAVGWPIQIPMATIAVAGLWAVHMGKPWRHWLVGALGGYGIAPVLAVAAWRMGQRRAATTKGRALPMRRVGIYGVHLAVAVLFLGYSFSTYFVTETTEELAIGDTFDVGEPVHLAGFDAQPEPDTPWVDRLRIDLDPDAPAVLYWEAQTGSHYPLPGTHRTWMRDLYVNIESVCVGGDGPDTCRWINAYDPSGRIAMTEAPAAARIETLALPGISMVWASLVLFAAYMSLILWTDATVGRRQGPELGKSP